MPWSNLEQSTQSIHKKTTDWQKKYTTLAKKYERVNIKCRELEDIIDQLSKKYQLIDQYIDVFTRTHLQAHWHKTKCHSANRKVLLSIDELFKEKAGYSWIEKHLSECNKAMCIFEKERRRGND